MEQLKIVRNVIFALIIAVCLLMSNCTFAFADTNTGGSGGAEWLAITNNEQLVAAWKAYCKTRNYEYKHTNKTLQAIVKWDYDTLVDICRKLNINIESLNAHIWYAYNESSYLKFFMDSTAISDLNRIYAQALVDAGLSNGEGSMQLYNGEYFEDEDGHGCYVFDVKTPSLTTTNRTNIINTMGTAYRWTYNENHPSAPTEYNIKYKIEENDPVQSKSYYLQQYDYINSPSVIAYQILSSTNSSYSPPAYSYYVEGTKNNHTYRTQFGCVCIIKFKNGANTTYYLGHYLEYFDNDILNYKVGYIAGALSTSSLVNVAQQQITAVQGALNNAPDPEKSGIYQAGVKGLDAIKDFLEDEDDPPVSYTPSDDEDPPAGDTNNNTNIGPFNVFGFINPNGEINFKMPKVTDIAPGGFALGDITAKFPFSLASDFYALINLLSDEPETPYFDTNVDFGRFHYHLEIDFTQFDNTMVIVRNCFTILYIFGLIFITKQLMG